MSGSLELVNGAEWDRALDSAFKDLHLASEDEIAGLGKLISANMRADAPVMDSTERAKRQSTPGSRERTRRKPGKATIRFIRGRDDKGFYVDVGPAKTAFYLAFYEYGTKFQRARPFLRPAIEKAIAAWGTAGGRS